MKQANCIAVLFGLALSSAAAMAQSANPALPTPAPARLIGSIEGHPGWPAAKPEDVSSPEAILAAVYSVISGPKGQTRDWDRMRSLFLPDARLILSPPCQPLQAVLPPTPTPSCSPSTVTSPAAAPE